MTLAGDGRQVLEYASLLSVRLILADIKMPVLSGLEMLEQLCARPIAAAVDVLQRGRVGEDPCPTI